MKKITASLLALMILIGLNQLNAQCTYQLRLDDSFGDGWNGNQIDVKSGTVTTTYTLDNGSDTLINLSVNTGDSIVLDYLAGGSFNGEVSFVLFDANSDTIFSSGAGPLTGIAFADTAFCPSCIAPTNRRDTNKTSTSIDLNWTDSAGTWQVEYDTAGFALGSGKDTTVSSKPLSLSNLSPLTDYDWYIRRICAPGDTSAWVKSSFKTAIQGPQGFTCLTGNTSVAFSDDLESMAGWTGSIGTGGTGGDWNYDGGGTGSSNTGPSAAHSGTQYVYFESSSGDDTASFISPAIDLTSGNDFAELSFWMHATGDDIGTLDVGVANSPSGPYTNEFSVSGEIQAAETDPWSNVGVNLDSYVGQTIYLRFFYTAGSSFEGDLALDLIEVSTCLSCAIPDSLEASNVNGSSASIDWVQNGSTLSWDVEYLLTGNAQGTGTISNTTTKPFGITGLSSGTGYDVYVRAICAVGDTSGWAGPFTFNTSNEVPYFENFESFSPGITSNPWPLGWSSNTTSNPKWESEDASGSNENSTGTGPFFDHTTPSTIGGMYVYLETSGGVLGDSADFVSPPIRVDSSQSTVELTFWYHMHGVDMGNLEVWIDTNGVQNRVFSVSGQQQAVQSDLWLEGKTFLNGYQGKNIQVVFRGFRGDGFTSDMSIDEIAIDTISSRNANISEILSPSGSLCPGAVIPSVEIQNSGLNALTSVGVVRDINGVLDTVNYSGNLTTGQVDTVNFPSFTFNSGVVYDIAFYTINPNGMSDLVPLDDTMKLNSIETGLSGTVTIDAGLPVSGTNFQSFTDFADQVNRLGLCGNVTVDVNQATYTETFFLDNIPGASSANTLTINGNDATLQFAPSSTDRRIVGFSQSSYVTLKNLNIVGTDPTYGYGIQFQNGAHHITIDSCSIDLSAVTSTSSLNSTGILGSGSITSPSTTGNNGSQITISNTFIDGGATGGPYYGIRFNGTSVSNADTNIRILNTEIANFYAYGIYLNNISNSFIEGNDIHRMGKTAVTTFYGVYTTGGSSADTVNANRIHNSHDTATSLTGAAYPIYNSSNDADVNNPNIFVNNLIYNINSNGTIYGIYNFGSDNQAYVNNTISLDYSAATGGTTRGFYQTSTASGITFVNNNISITRGGSGIKHGLYHNTTTSTINSDFNNVHVNSAGSGNQFFGRENLTDHNTLLNWQNASTLDSNSVSSSPLFVDETNGDLTPTSPDLDGAGTNLGVPVDFFGVLRSNPPDIGAIEFTPVSCLSPSALVATALSSTAIEFSWLENNSATQWEIEYDTTNFALGTGSRAIISTNPDTTMGLNPATSYEFYVRSICAIGDTSLWSGPISATTFIQGALGVNCTSGNASTVFTEEFDTQGSWTGDISSGSVNGDWNFAKSGTTTSSNTGPSGAHSGTNYVYFESSSGTSASMVSPAIDLGRAQDFAELSFWLHAYGATIGTLNVGVGTSATGPFTTEFTWNGELQTADTDPFQNVGVNLDQYVGDTIYIEFEYIKGSSFTGDLAIDLMEVEACILPFYSIGTINKEDSLGVADSLNVECITSGTVTGVDRRGGGYEFALIDQTSGVQEGITVFNFNDLANYTNPTEGDSILVYGSVSQFRGLTQFSPDSISLISTGNAITAPDTVTSLDESTESKLLFFENFVLLDPSGSNSFNMDATNGTDTITIRVDSDTDIDDSLSLAGQALNVGDTICAMLGIGGQFDNSSPFFDGYQVLPSRFADLTICPFVPPTPAIPFYSIGTINKEDSLGVADSLNVLCQISGTVTGIDRRGGGYEFALIDQSSGVQEGITVFNFNDLPNYTNPTEGDSILVYGNVSQFRGLTQFSPDSISLISTGNTITAPDTVTSLDESTESKLLFFENFVLLDPSGSGSFNMDATNGTDTITIRIDADTDIDDSLNLAGQALNVGDTICAMLGIGGQFDNSSPFFDGYQVLPSRFADLTICRTPPPTVIPFYSIGTINKEDSLGVADSLNVLCQTSGTVTGVNRRGGGYEFALIDQTSGVQEGIIVFDFNNLPNYTNPTEGDSILVYGRVSQFRGLTQFSPDSISLISSGNAITAADTVSSLDESTESKLLYMENFVLLDSSQSGSFNMRAVNGTDTITIRIDDDTDLDDSLILASNRLLVGDTICGMIGIGGQFDNSSPFFDGYQILPSRFADLTICKLLVGLNDIEIEETKTFNIYPNPSAGDFTFESSGFSNAAIKMLIRDLKGRVILEETILNANHTFRKSFNLSNESKGIYFISIIDGEQIINKKLILH